MTMFYETAFRLIEATCNTAIMAAEEKNAAWLQGKMRNQDLSKQKIGLLKQLLEELKQLRALSEDMGNLINLQKFLERYRASEIALTTDRSVTTKDTSGKTEEILENLLDSLSPTYQKFEHLQLLNHPYDKEEALHAFYCLIGLYHAHRRLIEKQEASAQKTASGMLTRFVSDIADRFNLLPDTKAFLEEQKRLVSYYFEQAPMRIKTAEAIPPEEKAVYVLGYIFLLRENQLKLMEAQKTTVKATPTYTTYSTMLSTLLEGAISELTALSRVNPSLRTAQGAVADSLTASLHESRHNSLTTRPTVPVASPEPLSSSVPAVVLDPPRSSESMHKDEPPKNALVHEVSGFAAPPSPSATAPLPTAAPVSEEPAAQSIQQSAALHEEAVHESLAPSSSHEGRVSPRSDSNDSGLPSVTVQPLPQQIHPEISPPPVELASSSTSLMMQTLALGDITALPPAALATATTQASAAKQQPAPASGKKKKKNNEPPKADEMHTQAKGNDGPANEGAGGSGGLRRP